MSKIYEVFMRDEWNNNYLLGFYDELNKAIPDIEEFLSIYKHEPITQLQEYTSTFDSCFDREVEVDDDNVVYIRGFILDRDKLLDELNSLIKGE